MHQDLDLVHEVNALERERIIVMNTYLRMELHTKVCITAY